MFIVETEYTMEFSQAERYLRDHAYELLTGINPDDIDFIRLGNPQDVSWDPAAISYRVLRNRARFNTIDFWLTRTRSGRALLAMTTEDSRYSTCASPFNENASEFEAARNRLVDELQQGSVDMLPLGQKLLAIDYPTLYDAALRRTFHDGAVPNKWREMPHVAGL